MQVLYSSEGYTYLDVRPKLENEEVGRVRNSVNIPMVNLRRVWDPEQKKKVLQKEDNEHFIDQARSTVFCRDCFHADGLSSCVTGPICHSFKYPCCML